MRKATKKPAADELRSEYKRSDFGALVRGKYVQRLQTCSNVVVLDPTLPTCFRTRPRSTLRCDPWRRLPSVPAPDGVDRIERGAPRPSLEGPLQMESAEAGVGGEGREVEGLGGMLFDEAAEILDGGGGVLQGFAAQARAQTGVFGLGGRLVEADVAAQRAARRAGGAAVDSGRDHADEEAAIEGRVALFAGFPALFF